jgi:hypothetical protein
VGLGGKAVVINLVGKLTARSPGTQPQQFSINLVGLKGYFLVGPAIANVRCFSSQRKIALLPESSQYIKVLSFAKVYEGSIQCLLSFYR